jgi:hypothetical protein
MPPSTIQTEPKAGLQTTEFWVTVVTLLLPVLTLIFHKDFSNQVEAIATVAAAIATAAYSVSRALAKSALVKAGTVEDAPQAR